jgi:hypothetical protein
MKDKFPKPTPDVGPAIRSGEAATEEGLTTSSSSLAAAARTLLYVNRPGPEDVLLGRGAPIIKYLGNVKFRAVVKSQKKAYQSTRRHSDKKAIAEDVIQIITSRNGRFLQRVKRGGSTAVSEEEEADEEVKEPSELLRSVWKIADEDAVLEKVKQALRDKDGFTARSCKAQQVPRLKNAAAAAAANKQASPMMNHHPDNLDGLLGLQQMMSSYPLSHRLIQASMIDESLSSSRSALNNNNNHCDPLLAPSTASPLLANQSPFLPSLQQQLLLQQMEQLRGLPDSSVLLSLMIAAAGHHHRPSWQLSPPPSETILHSLLEAQGHRSSSLLADYYHNRHNNEYVMRMMMMLQQQQQQRQQQQQHLPEANEEEQIMARARLALGN